MGQNIIAVFSGDDSVVVVVVESGDGVALFVRNSVPE